MKTDPNTANQNEFNENLPPYPLPEKSRRLINRRQIWAANRFWMEIDNLKTKKYGNKGHHRWFALLFLMKCFRFGIKATGLYEKGVQNAWDIVLRKEPLYFEDLPEPFDGFTILQLTDLHLDGMKNLEDKIIEILDGIEVDLCVFTGDYRTKLHGLNRHIVKGMEKIINRISSRNGFIGVLGNHDDCHMVNPLEEIGIKMLINSTVFIEKQGQKIQIIGTDDVHYYFTDQALHVLEHADKNFSVALIHSSELYQYAAEMGVNLYLCGHTHAGQVCLPGGIPIITHLNKGRRFYKGHWTYKGMQGYTSTGAGTSGIPVRFNTKGELVVFTLHKKTF